MLPNDDGLVQVRRIYPAWFYSRIDISRTDALQLDNQIRLPGRGEEPLQLVSAGGREFKEELLKLQTAKGRSRSCRAGRK